MAEVVDKRNEKQTHVDAKVGDLLHVTEFDGLRRYYTIVRVGIETFNAIELGGYLRLLTFNRNTVEDLVDFAFRTWPHVEYIPADSVKVTITIENA